MKCKYLIFLTLLFIGRSLFAQDNGVSSLNKLAARVMSGLVSDNKEIILVQTDRDFYKAGEAIWFQAYCLHELSHQFFRRSNSLFVDLVNDRDSIVSQLLMDLQKQKTDGNIFLPASLPEGYYWLRAYTKNILREDSSRIWVQPVYLLNNNKPRSMRNRAKSPAQGTDSPHAGRPVLTFFPEGGSLISGTNTVVAFRFLDEQAKPADVSGFLTDNLDSVAVVTRFSTSLPGFGKFSFTPWKSRKYTAHIKWKNQEGLSYLLPLINQYAYQLSVTGETPNDFTVQISLGDSLYQRNKTSYLLGISGDSLCFAGFGTDMYVVSVPKSRFPGGRAELLLFDDQGKIVSERSVYIDKKQVEVSIVPDKLSYGPREKVNLALSLNGSANEMALLSLAVTDDHMDSFQSQEIKWTNGQLGNLEIPSAKSNYTPAEWDLLMMIQKNAFSGHEYGRNDSAVSLSSNKEENKVEGIRGKVIDNENQPVSGQIINLVSHQSGSLFETDTTDRAGHFYFPFSGEDSIPFSLRLIRSKGISQHEKVILDSFRFPAFPTPAHLKKPFSEEEMDSILAFRNRDSAVTTFLKGKGFLKEVTVKAELRKTPTYEQSKRMSQFSYIISSEAIEKGENTENDISNMILNVPGITMRGGFLIMEGGGRNTGAAYEPMVVVDGVPQTIDAGTETLRSPDLNFLNSIQQDIDFIEILAGAQAAIYGMQGDNGVIAVYTLNGRNKSVTGNNTSNGFMKYIHKGYFNSLPFPQPDYDKMEIKKSLVPDSRTTIYWNGHILLNANGKENLHFFTPDTTAPYTITLTGVTTGGTIIYQVMSINADSSGQASHALL